MSRLTHHAAPDTMKLVQIQNGLRTEIQVHRAFPRPAHIELVLADVFVRAAEIRHLLLADDGTETPVTLEYDCSSEPPFIAIAVPVR